MSNFEQFCIRILDVNGYITKEDVLEFGYDEEHYEKLTKIIGTERLVKNAHRTLKEMGINYHREV